MQSWHNDDHDFKHDHNHFTKHGHLDHDKHNVDHFDHHHHNVDHFDHHHHNDDDNDFATRRFKQVSNQNRFGESVGESNGFDEYVDLVFERIQ